MTILVPPETFVAWLYIVVGGDDGGADVSSYAELRDNASATTFVAPG